MRAPETESAAIVLTGSFNPAIFQPNWLGTQQLIRPEEAENAKITTIQAELSEFSTEWFQLQVLLNRFLLVSTDPRQYPPLRDLASSLFTILPHTPVTGLGLSRQFHFKMASEASWHAIGHRLAPKESWNPIVERAGLRSMVIQGSRNSTEEGTIYIKVEPSLKITHGLYVEVTEEFKVPSARQSDGATWIPEHLGEWDAMLHYSETVAQHLLSLV